ncbi:hypothetical protein DMB66_36495 [Actinoplanes sp. ATCC 53533]|nr:hypothetical protein DMB66_36495 [Actinoplanes sp. ATCC 53533]
MNIDSCRTTEAGSRALQPVEDQDTLEMGVKGSQVQILSARQREGFCSSEALHCDPGGGADLINLDA